MKHALAAALALFATTTAAMAEVTLSGFGHFGIDYDASRPDIFNFDTFEFEPQPRTQISARLRFDIDANTTTDTGIIFGGRVRMEWDQGDAGAALSPAMLYAAAYGFRLEVGNANSAIHSAALMYDSELGAFNRSFGGPIATFFTYASGPFEDQNRMGVFASYAIDGLNLRASIIDPDQTTSFWFEKPEYAISADYRIGGFTLSGAYARNAGGDPDLDEWFLGAAYSVMPGATVGLLYSQVDNDNPFFGEDGRLVTLYGNYRVDDITYRGYIARANQAVVDLRTDFGFIGPGQTRTVFGLGVDYDLGGARLGADIHRNYSKGTVAGLGVRFDF
jgi:outer membrane protein OmpU